MTSGSMCGSILPSVGINLDTTSSLVDNMRSHGKQHSNDSMNIVTILSAQSAEASRFSMEPITDESLESLETTTAAKPIPASLQKRISKTKICIHNLSGRCTRGHKCSFAHSMQELKEPPDLYKTRLCITWSTSGSCSKGDSCRFAHGDSDLRSTPEFFKTSLCPYWQPLTKNSCTAGDKCRWAHGIQEIRQRGASMDDSDPNSKSVLPNTMAVESPSQQCTASTPGNLSSTCASPGGHLSRTVNVPPPPPPSQMKTCALQVPPPPPPQHNDNYMWHLGRNPASCRPVNLSEPAATELLEIENQRLNLVAEEQKILLQKEKILRERALNEELRRQLEARNRLHSGSVPRTLSPVASDVDFGALQNDVSLIESVAMEARWASFTDSNTHRVRADTVHFPSDSHRLVDFTPFRSTLDASDGAFNSKHGMDSAQIIQLLGTLGLGRFPSGDFIRSHPDSFDYPSFSERRGHGVSTGLDSMEWRLNQELQDGNPNPSNELSLIPGERAKATSHDWLSNSERKLSLELDARRRAASGGAGSHLLPENYHRNGGKSLKPSFYQTSSSISTTADSDIVIQSHKGSTFSFSGASVGSEDPSTDIWPLRNLSSVSSLDSQLLQKQLNNVAAMRTTTYGGTSNLAMSKESSPPLEVFVPSNSLQDMLRTILSE